MDSIINSFTGLIGENFFISIIVSFLAGLIASFSPCMLSTIPLVIGGVSQSSKKDKKAGFHYALIFSLGVIVVFMALGLITSILGNYVNALGKYVYIILGAILIFMGLKSIGVIGEKKSCKVPKIKNNLLGAFTMGILGGVLSSPCSTPILAVILTIVATGGNVLFGVIMLLVYGIGHCVLIVIAGTSVGFIEQLSSSYKYNKISDVIKNILGALIIVFGLYLLYLGM